jgi:hypothetical protein
MQATYQNHQYSRPGFGVLLINGLEGVHYAGDARFRLERMSDHLFLENSGWGKKQPWLSPSLATFRDGELRLLLGPSVVNQLEINASYRLYLDFGDHELEPVNDVFQVTEIMRSAPLPAREANPPSPPENQPSPAERADEAPQRSRQNDAHPQEAPESAPETAKPAPEAPESPPETAKPAPESDNALRPSRPPSLFDSLKPMRTLLVVIIAIFFLLYQMLQQ